MGYIMCPDCGLNPIPEEEGICSECRKRRPKRGWWNVVQERGLKCLYHFTDIENLPSIIANGLLSVNELLYKRKLKCSRNDLQRIDGKKNCICCSLEEPNNILMQKYKYNSNKAFCLFRISIDVLNHETAWCCPVNAATNHGREIKSLSKLEDLYISEGRNPVLPKNLPTNEQAEILIEKEISWDYIDAIIFETELSYNKVKDIIPDNIRCEVDGKLFQNRWYRGIE